jgi:hypothetical protein
MMVVPYTPIYNIFAYRVSGGSEDHFGKPL